MMENQFIISGTIAIWLNFFAIASISFFVANFVVSITVSFLGQKLLRLDVSSRRYALWLLVSMPWLASLVVGLCFMFPVLEHSPFSSVNGLSHWHHVDRFDLLSWHAVSLLFSIGFLMVYGLNRFRILVIHQQKLDTLHGLATVTTQSDVYQLETDEINAFCAGFKKQRCYVTSGLLSQTSKQEQEVIIKHELAHIAAYDPLKKWLFSVMAGFYLPHTSKKLQLQMTLSMEQAADQAVISSTLHPTLVASTLVKIAKLTAEVKPSMNSELVGYFSADLLEQRVYFLLGKLDLKPINRTLTTGLFALVLMVSVTSMDSIHHVIETVFSH